MQNIADRRDGLEKVGQSSRNDLARNFLDQSKDTPNAFSRVPFEVTLPNTDYFKSARSEFPIDCAIPCPVSPQFVTPISDIGPWNMAASRAAVPETTVHEQSDLGGRKHKVWAT